MKLVIDNSLAAQLAKEPAQFANNPLFQDENNFIYFRWPSLLEYLGLGSLLSELPPFDPEQPLFEACLDALRKHEEKESVQYVFDRLFTENLNRIIELPQLNPGSLMKEIANHKESLDESIAKILSPALDFYLIAFNQHSASMMHNLILYLGWERTCLQIAQLFDYQSNDAKFNEGIKTLQECLIESFQHITGQGRTAPSIFRLFEALFYYYMREEHLQKHTNEEWDLLQKGFKALKSPEKLADVFYIDDAVTPLDKPEDEESTFSYVVTEPSEKTAFRIAFSQLILEKIKKEVPDWHYKLNLPEIIHN